MLNFNLFSCILQFFLIGCILLSIGSFSILHSLTLNPVILVHGTLFKINLKSSLFTCDYFFKLENLFKYLKIYGLFYEHSQHLVCLGNSPVKMITYFSDSVFDVAILYISIFMSTYLICLSLTICFQREDTRSALCNYN